MISSSKAFGLIGAGLRKRFCLVFVSDGFPRDRISGTVVFLHSTCSCRRHVLLPSEIVGTALRLTMLLIKL